MSTQIILNQINEVETTALTHLKKITKLEELDQWRVTYLGRKGALTLILRELGTLSSEDKRSVGSKANDPKTLLQEQLAKHQQYIKEQNASQLKDDNQIDITLPGVPIELGRLHPTTQIVREICNAFVSMGFQVIDGPEVEWDHYNFEMLNIPKGHPARDMWNTLWVDYTDDKGEQNMLLRTHTSPMQGRIMEKTQPPIRVVIPGKCYRYEATDATHEWHFYQIEGLAVDEGITFSHMKGALYEFARRIFGPERRVRFRCDYFPFVEPGAEMAIDCFLCEGKGCRICQKTGWIEILGAGMVHPKVLEAVGYDPKKYTGFAFGMGPERIAMLKYGIDDIRHFYSNDLRFLRQF